MKRSLFITSCDDPLYSNNNNHNNNLAFNTHITCFYLHSLFLGFLSFSFQSSSTRNRTFQLRWFVVRRCRCWPGRHGTVRHGTGRHSNPCYLWTVTGWPPSHLPMAKRWTPPTPSPQPTFATKRILNLCWVPQQPVRPYHQLCRFVL